MRLKTNQKLILLALTLMLTACSANVESSVNKKDTYYLNILKEDNNKLYVLKVEGVNAHQGFCLASVINTQTNSEDVLISDMEKEDNLVLKESGKNMISSENRILTLICNKSGEADLFDSKNQLNRWNEGQIEFSNYETRPKSIKG